MDAAVATFSPPGGSIRGDLFLGVDDVEVFEAFYIYCRVEALVLVCSVLGMSLTLGCCQGTLIEWVSRL